MSVDRELCASSATEVTCWPGTKQRQLVAQVSFGAGDTIIAEAPLVSAPCRAGQTSANPWELVRGVLSHPGLLERYGRSRPQVTSFKFCFDRDDVQLERALAKKYGISRQFVRTLYFGMATNNIAYFNDNRQVAGHGFFETISKANHSCEPNAQLLPGDVATREVLLVASRRIRSGEPVTWNYGTVPEFLQGDYLTRNLTLFNHLCFVCRCDRCLREIPAELAKQQDLSRYFRSLIDQEAMRQLKTFVSGGDSL